MVCRAPSADQDDYSGIVLAYFAKNSANVSNAGLSSRATAS